MTPGDALSGLKVFLGELRRRRVYRVGAVYLVVGFLTLQVADIIFPALQLPPWAFPLLVVLVILGFPLALVLAWALEVTPEGVRITPAASRSPSTDPAADKVAARAAEAGRSIAVLPFVNMSPDLENDYFSDGMTEELINALAHLDGLKVAARTSAFSFKGRHEDVRSIGRKLNVNTVLEGSVRKWKDKLRVTAQLIEVEDGYHLWSETFDRELEDVFSIQEEIAQAIVDTLKLQLLGRAPDRLVKRYTDDVEAYNLYLKGRYCWNKRTEEGLKASVRYFERAAERDSDYALAHAGLADAYAVLGIAEYGFMPPRSVMPRAKEAALRALSIDDQLPEAQTQVAHIRAFFEWDWTQAEADFLKAMEIDPQYAFAMHWYASFLCAMGRHEEAVAMEKKARSVEPLSLIINKNVGTILYYAGRHDEALREYRKALEMEPDFARTHFFLGMQLSVAGQHDQAIAELETALKLDPGNSVILAVLGYAYGMAGKAPEAADVVRRLEEARRRSYVPAMNLAIVHAGRDDPDPVFEWLDAAYEERSSWLTSLKVEPMFERLRPDPRFDALARRIGLTD
jgi:TolB-like protein/Tfp pilus assembly protein PilF